jgi:UDP-N-acetylglucosamine--N-acetylmuramyl-(pentapeptide) pyrophosphoryl-undecaprenol N-acetylglucosamine transferase
MGLAVEDLLWIGTQGETEETLVPRENLHLETIAGGAIVGVPWQTRMKNATKLILSTGKAALLIRKFRPNVLLMTGGYVNAPVAPTAWLQQVPAAIYLPDIEPGMAIRRLSRLVKRVACTAEASKAYFSPGKSIVTGYPVRRELRQASEMNLSQALANFELEQGRPTLLVTGGSRGARSINRALMASLPELLAQVQVIHISGTHDWPEIEANAEKMNVDQRAFYRPYPYLHEQMGPAFRAADLVLARAGASMLGECPAFGLPAILVPYPYAWRYQKVNADYLAQHGAAIRLEDETLPERLLPTILPLLQDKNRLAAMSAAARSLDVPDSATRLARLLLDLGRGKIT